MLTVPSLCVFRVVIAACSEANRDEVRDEEQPLPLRVRPCAPVRDAVPLGRAPRRSISRHLVQISCHMFLSSVRTLSVALPAQVVPVPMTPNAAADGAAAAAAASSQDFIICFVNGKKHVLYANDIQPAATLLHFLRDSQRKETNSRKGERARLWRRCRRSPFAQCAPTV